MRRELNVAEAGEGLLVGPVEEAEGVVELEGDLGAELALEGREGRGGPGGRSRGEGGGGGDKEECAAEEEEDWSKVSVLFRSKQKQTSTQHSLPHSSPLPSCCRPCSYMGANVSFWGNPRNPSHSEEKKCFVYEYLVL